MNKTVGITWLKDEHPLCRNMLIWGNKEHTDTETLKLKERDKRRRRGRQEGAPFTTILLLHPLSLVFASPSPPASSPNTPPPSLPFSAEEKNRQGGATRRAAHS